MVKICASSKEENKEQSLYAALVQVARTGVSKYIPILINNGARLDYLHNEIDSPRKYIGFTWRFKDGNTMN